MAGVYLGVKGRIVRLEQRQGVVLLQETNERKGILGLVMEREREGEMAKEGANRASQFWRSCRGLVSNME
jgi:hypothetical protein